MDVSNYDLEIAARTIWAESRGEPEEGQKAVAHVLINRLHSGKWSSTLAGVCISRLQFSCWNQDDPNRLKMNELPSDDPLLTKFHYFLEQAMTEPDPINGALYYYSISIPVPVWVKNLTFVKQIGNHRFYK